MDSYILSSSHYLGLKNGKVIESHLPDHISYQDSVFVFENQEPVEVQIVYILETNMKMDICFEIKKDVKVNFIETKLLSQGAVLHKNMHIDENAIVHVFSENNCQNQERVQCFENVYL